MNNDIGLDKRTTILTYALLLETISSTFLANLIGIEKPLDSISFGNKSTSLSFNQKINLLIDIRALQKDEKKKYQTFMEIRNQFMHNLGSDTFESCYDNLDGKDKFVLQLYPQNMDLTRERKLELASCKLADYILNQTIMLIDKIKEKIGKEIQIYEDFISKIEKQS